MSSTELARRMGVGQSSVIKIEQSEANDTVKLDSLHRAAEALDCDVIYFLVPRRPLEATVRDRSRVKAAQYLAPVAHHSRLEDQAVTAADLDSQLDELADRFVDLRGLWTDEDE
jgi:predicted DNA-binding mobile mystery protein A